MWSTEAQRHPETLRAAHGDVGTEFAGRFDERERQQVCCDDDECACRVGFFRQRCVIVDYAKRVRILHEHATGLCIEGELLRRTDDHFDVERLGARVENLDRHFGQAAKDIEEIKISSDKATKRARRLDNFDFEELAPDQTAISPARVIGATAAE